MAGGTWTTQNKVRPGVYIDFEGQAQSLGTAGERGTVAMALPLSWGAPKQMLVIQAGEELTEKLGYALSAPQTLLVREVLKQAKTLLLYRLNAGVKAQAAQGTITFKAKYGGVRGNDIKIVIQANIDDNAKFDVKTVVSGSVVDLQTVANLAALASNAWVEFGGTGTLAATAGLSLTGGADGTTANQDYTDFLAAVEVHDFNTLALVSNDSTLKSVYTAFVKRLREEEGRKVQAVLSQYPGADHEGIISVKNGVILADGSTLDSVQATAWVAGATAGAGMDESLTYQAYEDAVDTDLRYTHTEIEAALNAGEFVFVQNRGRAIVELDLNTFRSFSPAKGRAFSKNRVIRVMDGIANDFKTIFETFYIGKVDNNIDGHNLLRGECVAYLSNLQDQGIIQGFNAQSDIKVLPGADSGSVYIELHVQPVDAIEKVYMKVKVK